MNPQPDLVNRIFNAGVKRIDITKKAKGFARKAYPVRDSSPARTVRLWS